MTSTEVQDGYAGHATVEYLQTSRPWLSLYGLRLRHVELEVELSPIQKLIPDELLLEIFSRVPPYSLARAAVACKHWSKVIKHPSIWERACLAAWQTTGWDANKRLVREDFGNSWWTMWLERPRLRTDGLYVSRNTYIKPGLTIMRQRNPVHLVVYYRYYHFRSNGTFRYKTTPEQVASVAKVMQSKMTAKERHKRSIYDGRYHMDADTRGGSCHVHISITHSGTYETTVRTKLGLRSTCRGANNRLDIHSIASFSGADADRGGGEDNEGGGVVKHSRGMSTCVFVPWCEATDHPLNLPVSEMDFWVPG